MAQSNPLTAMNPLVLQPTPQPLCLTQPQEMMAFFFPVKGIPTPRFVTYQKSGIQTLSNTQQKRTTLRIAWISWIPKDVIIDLHLGSTVIRFGETGGDRSTYILPMEREDLIHFVYSCVCWSSHYALYSKHCYFVNSQHQLLISYWLI